MLLSQRLIDLINYRIEQEEYSNRVYKAMSIVLEFNGFEGAAKYWSKSAKDEIDHAQWSYDYLLSLNIKPKVPMLQEPPCEYDGFEDIIKKTYEHEVMITNQCKEFAKACAEEGDYMTLHLVQHYLDEQVEELKWTQGLLDKLVSFGTSPEALRLLDNELGSK